MGPFEMVVAIVGISAVASVVRARHGGGGRRRRGRDEDFAVRETDGEADLLRGEVRQLKDRIQVLEAIVTDGDRNRALALEREIEALRGPVPTARGDRP
jgi:hypothetical protein